MVNSVSVEQTLPLTPGDPLLLGREVAAHVGYHLLLQTLASIPVV